MFGAWNEESSDNSWMSYTDLMTGLLVIFLITTLSLSILKTDEDILANKYTTLVQDFEILFEDEPSIIVADSATIRFTLNENAFDTDKHKPTENLTAILDEFIPKYYSKLQNLFLTNKDSFLIQEIRIEGHTDSIGKYTDNLSVSSGRALAIQKYIVRHDYFNDSLEGTFQAFLYRNTIPVGYAYTRPLDTDGKSISDNDLQEYSKEKSRRVEFRVLIEYLK